MTVYFINPQKRSNKADLTYAQIERLKAQEGYQITLILKPRITISDSVCTACEA